MRFPRCCLPALLALVPAFAPAQQAYRFAITDLEGIEQAQREFGPFRDLLQELTDATIEFFPVANRTVAVEAMRSGKLDFALTGPAEYVVFKSRASVTPVVGFARPDYFTCIITMTDKGYDNLNDLQGQKIAMGDIGSTSKHLAAMQLFGDSGMDPRRDIRAVHTSMRLGWEGLKKGDVEAFATTNNKFQTLRAREDNLEPGAFRVIARGGDLPNDVLLAGAHIDAATVSRFRQIFGAHSGELIAALLQGEDNQKYTGMKFVTTIADADYNPIRMMYQTAGYPQFSAFIDE